MIKTMHKIIDISQFDGRVRRVLSKTLAAADLNPSRLAVLHGISRSSLCQIVAGKTKTEPRAPLLLFAIKAIAASSSREHCERMLSGLLGVKVAIAPEDFEKWIKEND